MYPEHLIKAPCCDMATDLSSPHASPRPGALPCLLGCEVQSVMISKARNKKTWSALQCTLHPMTSLEHYHFARSSEAWQQKTSLAGRGQGPGSCMPPLLVLMQVIPIMSPWGWRKARAPSMDGSVVYSTESLSRALQLSIMPTLESSLMGTHRSEWFLFLPSSGMGPWSLVTKFNSELRG